MDMDGWIFVFGQWAILTIYLRIIFLWSWDHPSASESTLKNIDKWLYKMYDDYNKQKHNKPKNWIMTTK